jgi:hypothetical protein
MLVVFGETSLPLVRSADRSFGQRVLPRGTFEGKKKRKKYLNEPQQTEACRFLVSANYSPAAGDVFNVLVLYLDFEKRCT